MGFDDDDDDDLPALTPEEEAYERACDALVEVRLLAMFGPKLEFTDDEIEAALEKLEAEGAFPDPP